jgi:hypothetical protein
MENCALSADILKPFAPIAASAIKQAFEIGLIDIQALSDIVQAEMIDNQSDSLAVFARTSTTFDRKRDFEEELNRLAALESSPRLPLWAILVRLALSEHPNIEDLARTVDVIYEFLGHPNQLARFTSFGGVQFGFTFEKSRLRPDLECLLTTFGI